MTDNPSYQADTEIISQGRMQFHVNNRHPAYTTIEKKKVSADIEHQLFKVFSKYEKLH